MMFELVLVVGNVFWVPSPSGNAALSVDASTGISGKRLQFLIQVKCFSMLQFLLAPRSGYNPKLFLLSSVALWRTLLQKYGFSSRVLQVRVFFFFVISLYVDFRGFRPSELFCGSNSFTLGSCRSSQVAWMAQAPVFNDI